MKRSEAVFMLENSLGLPKDTCEKILIAVEEAVGMLPPATGKLTVNYTDMGIMPEHEWEKEDGK